MPDTTTSYLLKGDISGIQDFIFNVTSKGAAKTLKARSYYVQIVGDLACTYSMQHLAEAMPFYEGGGSFFIQFTARDNSHAALQVDALRDYFNKQFLQEDLLINIAFVPYKVENFSQCWPQLHRQSNLQKIVALSSNHSFFIPFQRQKGNEEKQQSTMPAAYEKILEAINPGIPTDSNIYRELTNLLVKKESLLIELFEQVHTKKKAHFDGSLINKLPFWKDYRACKAYRGYRKRNQEYYTDNIDSSGDNLIDFDALGDFAAHRTGTAKIGIAKLDVDNLGKLFGSATEKQAKEYSEAIFDFFTRKLYCIYCKEKINLTEQEETYQANIYPVYAGGDDCFLVGAWDALLCFIKDLHNAFTETFRHIHVDEKPITLSAGIVFVSPTYPVSSFAELAETALGSAKASGKNLITLFELVFSWDEFKCILNTSKYIAQAMEDDPTISRAFLDKVRKSAAGFNALQNNDGADFNRIYKLKYYLGKNEEKLGPIVEKLFDPYYEALKNKLLGKEGTGNPSIYPAIARITELLTKPKLTYD